jgi:hypothetical protein
VRDVNVATSFSFGVSEAGSLFLDTLSLELAVGEVKVRYEDNKVLEVVDKATVL